MQDIIKKYKQYKLLSNLGIVVTSLIMAVGINFFIIDSTNIGQSLKTSVLNASINQNLADIFLEKQGNNIILKSSKSINNVENLSFNISYNPETLTIKNIASNSGQVLNLSNNPGINSVSIIFNKPKNINRLETIAIVKVSKKNKNKTENINIFDAYFKDNTTQTSLLTTSGISF